MRFIWLTLTLLFGVLALTGLFPPYQPSSVLGFALLAVLTYFFYRKWKTTSSARVMGEKTTQNIANIRLAGSEINQLYEMSLEILKDDVVDLNETKRLREWFNETNDRALDDRVSEICFLVETALDDKILDEEEAEEIFTELTEFCYRYETNSLDSDNNEFEGNEPVEIEFNLATFKSGEHLKMIYTDARGNTTERELVYKKAVRKGSFEYIKAICLNKRALRTFRRDRVVRLFSLDTGEIDK